MTKNSIKKTTLLIVCSISLVLFSLAARQYIVLKEMLSEYEIQKSQLEEVRSDISRIRESLERFNQEKIDFRSYLFEEKDVPTFIEGLSHFAKESSVNILDMKTKRFSAVVVPDEHGKSNIRGHTDSYAKKIKSVKGKGDIDSMLTLAAMSISLRVEGKFSSLVKFLEYLEGFKQLLSITDIEIVREKTHPRLECSFILKIYSLKTLKDLE